MVLKTRVAYKNILSFRKINVFWCVSQVKEYWLLNLQIILNFQWLCRNVVNEHLCQERNLGLILPFLKLALHFTPPFPILLFIKPANATFESSSRANFHPGLQKPLCRVIWLNNTYSVSIAFFFCTQNYQIVPEHQTSKLFCACILYLLKRGIYLCF